MKKVIGGFSCTKFQGDLQMTIPEGYFGKTEPRSRLAITQIGVAGGVIDFKFRV